MALPLLLAPYSLPTLPEEIIQDILLRLPPEDPKWLLRSSLVCKDWRSLIFHIGFRCRLHELHGRPPVLGFLQNSPYLGSDLFIPTMASRFSVAVPQSVGKRQAILYGHGSSSMREPQALDYRHNRALFLSGSELIVWDPITGYWQRVPVPRNFRLSGLPAAAVICAADRCDHRVCHRGPFHIIYVFHDGGEGDGETDDLSGHTSVSEYSSETTEWCELKPIQNLTMFFEEHTNSVLVKKSLLYFVSDGGNILEYNLARHNIARISPAFEGKTGIHLILTQDGGLGAAESSCLPLKIQLWSGDVSAHSNAKWAKSRVIDLANSPSCTALSSTSLKVMGFAEGANVIFYRTSDGVFTIDLDSERIRQLFEDNDDATCANSLVPICTFYTPSSTKLERAQELLGKGYQAIQKKKIANALDFLSHAINIRVACYTKFAPECATRIYEYGCALYESQELANYFGNDLKSAANEQSLKSISCKDDTVNSKASGSNIDDSSLKKGDFEEGQNSNGKGQDDVNLASEMLDLARELVEKRRGNTMEEVKILLTLVKFCFKRGDIHSCACFFQKALVILEHLVESHNPPIVSVFEVLSAMAKLCLTRGNHENSIPFMQKAFAILVYLVKRDNQGTVSELEVAPEAILSFENEREDFFRLCRSRIHDLKNTMDAMLAEGDSLKPTLKYEMMYLADVLVDLKTMLEEEEEVPYVSLPELAQYEEKMNRVIDSN